jgi:hypothetical protein
MMERMNFMMGNVCGRLEKVGKHGNMAGTCTQDVRKVGGEPKSNNGSRAGQISHLFHTNWALLGPEFDELDVVLRDP